MLVKFGMFLCIGFCLAFHISALDHSVGKVVQLWINLILPGNWYHPILRYPKKRNVIYHINLVHINALDHSVCKVIYLLIKVNHISGRKLLVCFFWIPHFVL